MIPPQSYSSIAKMTDEYHSKQKHNETNLFFPENEETVPAMFNVL